MTNDRQILEGVSRVSIQLLLREPFYAHILACLNKEIVGSGSEVKTLAIGVHHSSYVLFVNSAFWEGIQSQADICYGLLKHELLHLIFKHSLADTPKKDRLLVDIAMDLVVNQYIHHDHLSSDAILIHHFPELELIPDQTWIYYYERLEELQTELWGSYQRSRGVNYLKQLRSGSTELDRHQPWEEFRVLTSLEKSILEGVMDNLIERAHRKTPEKSIGNLPGGLKIYLEGLFVKSQQLIDWRRVIRLFAASSAKTRIKNTIHRPSKRYGIVPGIKVKRLRKLLVAVDTSGSISEEATRLFFNEIYRLWRQGAQIRIIECDVNIQQSYEYRGKPPTFVFGGGGTSFDAPVEYGNQHFQPDGLIYFTDGYASIPQIKARFPILWVLSPDGLAPHSTAFRKLPGRKAKLLGS